MKVTKEAFEKISTMKPPKKHILFSLYLLKISVRAAFKALKDVSEGLL